MRKIPQAQGALAERAELDEADVPFGGRAGEWAAAALGRRARRERGRGARPGMKVTVSVSPRSSAGLSNSALSPGGSPAATRSTTASSSWRARRSIATITAKRSEIIYAEVTREDQLAVVGVLDSNEITRIEQPVYFSGTYAPTHGVDGLRERSFVALVPGCSACRSPSRPRTRRLGSWHRWSRALSTFGAG